MALASGPFGLFRYGFGPGASGAGLPRWAGPWDLSRGDYKRNADGSPVTGTIARQRVVIALSTELGSMPSSPTVGSAVPSIDRDDGRLDLTVLRDAERALKPMIDDGTVRIDSVAASAEGDELSRTVVWTDLETGESFGDAL